MDPSNQDEAQQIIQAKNQAERQPVLNLQIAQAYLAGMDKNLTPRAWQQAIEVLTEPKHGANRDGGSESQKTKPSHLCW